MKKIILLILITSFSCSKDENINNGSNNNENSQGENSIDCVGDYSTTGVLVDINEEIYNDDESVNNYSRY